MLFRDIVRPNSRTLRDVLNGRRLDMIAPFARSGPLGKILSANHDRVRIVTRLPIPGQPLPKRLDNDPRDFLDLVTRVPRTEIYAMPDVHTKLYLNGARAYFGSANFTSFGFGGRPEALVWTSDAVTYQRLADMFEDYRVAATRVGLPSLRRLARQFEAGAFSLTATPENPDTLFPNPLGDDQGDFRTWLAATGEIDAQYIENRFDPGAGYNMTGHTQSAFPGLRAFLRENLDLIPELASQVYAQRQFWLNNADATDRLRRFVRAKGGRFPARGGGDWRHKLPPFLGGYGAPGGGRGSGLIARMLIYLSRYAIEEGY
jgi:hypothetical protein